ncbi:phosphatidylglycerophosphatase [Roseibium litorale]|uniref:Phosphatidylglycerophosphatase n=1 Tax=Roseibium litorale TaxID=2803841 RepID=A0ABR9CGQ2_9HYPH|nr:phosphatidylglycerophosphatase [Roseibium litorale]MBD8890062.1 phosphatidylglycerophosphatase [Roseibium litorale]
MISSTWLSLFGLAGLFNPLSLVIGAWMGWRADQRNKILIAGFAAATLSLFVETGLGLTGLPQIISHDAGALAMFPFRFAGGALAALIAFGIASRRNRNAG